MRRAHFTLPRVPQHGLGRRKTKALLVQMCVLLGARIALVVHKVENCIGRCSVRLPFGGKTGMAWFAVARITLSKGKHVVLVQAYMLPSATSHPFGAKICVWVQRSTLMGRSKASLSQQPLVLIGAKLIGPNPSMHICAGSK